MKPRGARSWGYYPNTIVYWGYKGIMEKKKETTIIENPMEKKMENEMETVIIG